MTDQSLAAHDAAPPPAEVGAAELLAFWRAAGEEKWFAKDEEFDRAAARRFMALQDEAARGSHDGWVGDAEGALALVILLDQIPRNVFRGTARAFATDAKALGTAREAILAGHDQALPPPDRQFFYLPFMHSEALGDQETSVRLYEAMGAAEPLRYARIHHDIIARFGRFPHRNPVLGRETTAAERAFLDGGGFAG